MDLVAFENKPSKDENGNICKYVLRCFDVFSRYSFLRRLKSKGKIEGTNQSEEIFIIFDSPRIIQRVKGSEFQGILLNDCLHLLTGKSLFTCFMFKCQVVLCLTDTKEKTKNFINNFSSTHCVLILI